MAARKKITPDEYFAKNTQKFISFGEKFADILCDEQIVAELAKKDLEKLTKVWKLVIEMLLENSSANPADKLPVLINAYCDSAEQLLIKSFRQAVGKYGVNVKNALKKPVNTRINMLNRLIAGKRFFVCNECPHVIEAIRGAVWDERNLHKDVRLDNGTSNIDSLDALEYSFERYERQLFGF